MPGIDCDGGLRRSRADGMIQTRGRILEVAREAAVHEAHEVVHVEIGRRLGLGRALGKERNGRRRQTAGAGAARAQGDAAARPVKPGLHREIRRSQTRCDTHRHIVIDAVEQERRGVRLQAAVGRARVAVGAVQIGIAARSVGQPGADAVRAEVERRARVRVVADAALVARDMGASAQRVTAVRSADVAVVAAQADVLADPLTERRQLRRGRHPHGSIRQRPVARPHGVHGGRRGALVQTPPVEQARGRRDLRVHGALDLRLCAYAAPDPHLVDAPVVVEPQRAAVQARSAQHDRVGGIDDVGSPEAAGDVRDLRAVDVETQHLAGGVAGKTVAIHHHREMGPGVDRNERGCAGNRCVDLRGGRICLDGGRQVPVWGGRAAQLDRDLRVRALLAVAEDPGPVRRTAIRVDPPFDREAGRPEIHQTGRIAEIHVVVRAVEGQTGGISAEARIGRADVAVIALGSGTAAGVRRVLAVAARAGVGRARVAVVAIRGGGTAARRRRVGVQASGRGGAGVGRAGVVVVAVRRGAGRTAPAAAEVGDRAGVAVAAGGVVAGVHARVRRAGVVGADVGVVALGRGLAAAGDGRVLAQHRAVADVLGAGLGVIALSVGGAGRGRRERLPVAGC